MKYEEANELCKAQKIIQVGIEFNAKRQDWSESFKMVVRSKEQGTQKLMIGTSEYMRWWMGLPTPTHAHERAQGEMAQFMSQPQAEGVASNMPQASPFPEAMLTYAITPSLVGRLASRKTPPKGIYWVPKRKPRGGDRRSQAARRKAMERGARTNPAYAMPVESNEKPLQGAFSQGALTLSTQPQTDPSEAQRSPKEARR